MKKVFYLAVLALVVLCSACKEEYTTPINPLAISLFAPGGNDTYYEYADARSNEEPNFTVKVTDYSEYTNTCSERKVYSQAITYKLGGDNCTVYSNSCTEDNTAYIKVNVPHVGTISLTMDAEGKCQEWSNYEVLASYDVNGVSYPKVHKFDYEIGTDVYHFFYAENVGLIWVYDKQQKVSMKLIGHQIYS